MSDLTNPSQISTTPTEVDEPNNNGKTPQPTIIPSNYLPSSKSKLDTHVHTAFKDEIDALSDDERAAFVMEKRESMIAHMTALKQMAHDKVESIATFAIVDLKIKSPTGYVRNIQEFNTFTKFCTQTAKSTEEVKLFFKTFLFPVQFASFDQAKRWHIHVVEDFMTQHNLAFKTEKEYKGNSLRNVVTQARNTFLKNKNRSIEAFTGMKINVTKIDKDDKKPRDMGVWYDYFTKWNDYEKGNTLENAWNTARKGEWNIDVSTGRFKYDDASIDVIRDKRNNNGWDRCIIGSRNSSEDGKAYWEDMVNIFFVSTFI